MKSVLTRNQTKTIKTKLKNSKLYPDFNGTPLEVTIRYDDSCRNGHNSFSITGAATGKLGAYGCIHDLIVEQCPELEKYIKWHLTSSDGPMHYVANSMYHAKEVKKNTVVRRYDERLKFDGIPFTFNLDKRLKAFIEEGDLTKIDVISLVHPDNGIEGKYQYSDNYSFLGLSTNWYESLFSTEREAQEMAQALMNHKFDIIRTVSSYEDEKIPDLKAARSCAIWPEANLEDFTKEKLEARLEGLLTEFREAMIELGFVY